MERRDKVLRARLTDEERRIMDELAEREHTTASELIRRWIWAEYTKLQEDENE